MAVMEDLPTEILEMILEKLPAASILYRLCCVSWRFQILSTPLLYKSFTSVSDSTTPDRFRLFSETIMKNPTYGKHVKSIQIENAEWTFELRELLLPLLSNTPNIHHLTIPEYVDCLTKLRDPLEQGRLSLPYLHDFHFSANEFTCRPTQLWEFIKPFPKLSQLSMESCWYRQIESSPSHPSLSLQHITLKKCYLNNDSVRTLILGCQCLKTFRYLWPESCWLVDESHFNAQQIYQALLSHRDSLEEVHIELPYYPHQRFDETPKFGSFQEFSALERLGVDKTALSAKPSLPPSLSTLIIRCSYERDPVDLFENIVADVTLTSLNCIQLDDGFAANVFASAALVQGRRIQVGYASSSYDGLSTFPIVGRLIRFLI
jgi:hypothetical protein